MANECVPYYTPAQTITGKATADITGCRFVKIDGTVSPGWQPEGLQSTATPNVVPVTPLTTAIKAFGVAQKDVANGKLVGVFRYGVVPVLSGAAVVPGVQVESDSTGRAVTLASGVALGMAMSRASAANQIIAVALDL